MLAIGAGHGGNLQRHPPDPQTGDPSPGLKMFQLERDKPVNFYVSCRLGEIDLSSIQRSGSQQPLFSQDIRFGSFQTLREVTYLVTRIRTCVIASGLRFVRFLILPTTGESSKPDRVVT